MSHVVSCVISPEVIASDGVVGALGYTSTCTGYKESVCSLVVRDGVIF